MLDREFLLQLKAYIEDCEERIEGEWGMGQSVEKLIAKGDMPEVYWEVTRRLEAINA